MNGIECQAQEEEVNPAILAAREADNLVLQCLQENKSFLLEAGAGAGKTYSLIETLRYLIRTQSKQLLQRNQRIACITYTNVATKVINSRIDGNPLVFTDTIHAFCWSLIKNFQPFLRKEISNFESWKERLAKALELGVGIGTQRVEYDLGYRKITEKSILLHHDDVLALTEALLPLEKFQGVLAGKFPFILIDEYQDTNIKIMAALKTHIFGRQGMPLLGLFGDHWQRIYEKTCGHVTHSALTEIGKKANFRSSTSVVSVLNQIRLDLPQEVKEKAFVGSAAVYHTNSWVGTRQTGGHWGGDLPKDIAHQYLEAFITKLEADGWDFSPAKTKILILTHKVLASEQGYPTLEQVFPYNDLFIKKEDPYIAFFVDTLEPACDAYKRRCYGEMFSFLGDAAPRISSHAEKVQWSTVMDKLIVLRESGSIGQVGVVTTKVCKMATLLY